jgi:hypothetical protein
MATELKDLASSFRTPNRERLRNSTSPNLLKIQKKFTPLDDEMKTRFRRDNHTKRLMHFS